MLAAVALALRPTRRARRAGGVRRADHLRHRARAGADRRRLHHAARVPTAHNGRMVIFILMALALLAAFGLDDLSGRELPSLRQRRVALGAAAASSPSPWLDAGRRARSSRASGRARCGWRGASRTRPPAPALNQDEGNPVAAARSPERAVPVAAAGGRGAGADRPAAGRDPAVVLAPAGSGLRDPGRALLAVDLFRANMGFNPAIRHRARRAAHHRRDPLPPVARAQPLRGVGRARRAEPAAGRPGHALRALRRAWLRLSGRAPLRPALARHRRPRRRSASADHGGRAHGGVAAHAEPAGRDRRAAGGRRPAPALPGLRQVYSGIDGRVYRNANALPRAFLVDRQRTVPGDARRWRRSRAPASTRAGWP